MTTLPAEQTRYIKTLQRWGSTFALLGIVLCVAGYFADPARFFQSYLLGYIFWVNLSLGSLGVLMLHHMTSGKWGFAVQRYAEAGAKTIVLMAVLFIPVIAGMSGLYPWMNPARLAEAASRKLAYLNSSFFIGRALLYFVLWIGMSFLLARWSRRQDETRDARYTVLLRRVSAPGLIIYVLSTTFAATDWVMSLEPDWFSTIYGFLFVASQGLAAFALCVMMLKFFSRTDEVRQVAQPGVFLDLGNLILASVILWAYMSFSQLLIIWSGNLPEEISWYVRRLGLEWRMVALVLVVLHFLVPFLILLIRQSKRSSTVLWKLAAGIMVMRIVDVYWLVMPAFQPEHIVFHWLDFAAFAAIGGLWLLTFSRLLGNAGLVPAYDPRFAVLPETSPAAGATHG